MTKRWSICWLGMGIWFLISASLGFLTMWTATSNIMPDFILKGIAILFGAGLGFGAIVFLWIGIREWNRNEGQKKEPSFVFSNC